MPEKRGLFETIFGKRRPPEKDYQTFKLLNSYTSSFVPYSGRAWDVDTVRSAVHAFARRAAIVQPRHIRRGDGKITDVSGGVNNLLQNAPNPYSTAYKLYYRAAVQYKLYNNAFIYPVWGPNGSLEALYNINAQEVNLLEYEGQMYAQFRFINGKSYIFPYDEFIHVGSMFCEHDVFGDPNTPIAPTLRTADTFQQSMNKSAELVAVVRGILEVAASTKSEDLKARRNDFINDNLAMGTDGAGIIVTDNKYHYTPITDKQTPIPTGQLDYIKDSIYDYFGVNEDIIQNKATRDQESDFYEGEIKPFLAQMQQAFTNCLFSDRERGTGNEIVFEGNRLQFASTGEKLETVKYLSDIGGLTLDQALTTLGFPPIGGEEGKRRVQTLNVVNADKADQYQLGDDPKDKKEEQDDVQTE